MKYKVSSDNHSSMLSQQQMKSWVLRSQSQQPVAIKLQLTAAFLMLCPNRSYTPIMPSQTSMPYLRAYAQSPRQASRLNALWRFPACRNEPNVHAESQKENEERWHGAELSVTILGNWQYYRSKVLK